MSHELVYTSAQQGLKPGSYGFCTVIATEGISKALQDRLESLSGYEPAFALTDRRANLNPVNFSHLIVTVANQKFHVLSRVADAGADYSGRSNKFAHHVALLPNELTAASSASTLATPDFCKTVFDGNPRWLPQGVKPPATPSPAGPCTAWAAVCKDAGWAGVLADQTLKNPGRPISLIYSPGCNVLPLVVEAINLLPGDWKWKATFSTYFTKLPAGIECQWRFILDGTAAADQARRNLQSPPVDLTNPGPVPFNSPLVEQARTGQIHASSPAAGPAPAPKRGKASEPPPVAGTSTGRSAESTPDSYKLGPLPKSMRTAKATVAAPTDNLFAKKQLSSSMLIATIAGCASVLIVVAGLGLSLATTSRVPPIPDTTPKNSADTIVKNNDSRSPDKRQTTVVAVDKNNSLGQPIIATTAQPPDNPEEPKENVKPSESRLTEDILFKDILLKRKILLLPKNDQGVFSSDTSPQELCRINVKQSNDCQLSVFSAEMLIDGQPRFFLEPQIIESDGVSTWIAKSRAKNAFTERIDEEEIGRFTLKDQKLSFAWKRDAPDWTSPFGLTYCKLDVNVGNKKVRCSLTEPIDKPAERVSFKSRKAWLPVEIPAGTLTSVQSLRYDIEVRLDDWSEVKTNIAAKDRLKFEIPGAIQLGETSKKSGSSETSSVFTEKLGTSPEKKTNSELNSNVDLEIDFETPTVKGEAKLHYSAFIYVDLNKSSLEGFKQERTDKIDERMKDGIIFADFADMKKKGSDDQSKLRKEMSTARSALKRLESQKSELLTPEDRLAYFSEVTKQRDQISKLEEREERGVRNLQWTSAMESRLRTIEERLEVRFTFYLELGTGIDKEKIVLVETKPPPSKGKNSSTKKEEKTSTPVKERDESQSK